MPKPLKIILMIAAALAVGFTGLMIFMVLAIPHFMSVIKTANQTSAMASLRMLNSAEGQYNATYPDHGFACSLAALGGSSPSGQPTSEAAQLIGDDLASGNKSGYTFKISGCTKTKIDKQEPFTGYHITAVPISPRHTGDLGYCTDETARVYFDPTGGTRCTELLQ